MRLDAYLSSVEPELSRSRIKALIESGEARLDGQSTKPSKLLKGGEVVSIDIEPPRPVDLVAEGIPLRIIYEDAALVVVDKPAGMAVHPGAGNLSGTLVNALLAHCTDLGGIGGELRPGIVHRLDKETSGCLVVAKTEPVLAALQAQFKQRSVQKTYLALVHGQPADRGRFETLHGRHPTDRRRFTGRLAEGRRAVTEWEVVERFEGASLVRVALLTGRTHQIRMHFSEAGHPLLGDELYGGVRREKRMAPGDPVRRAAVAIGRQALHAARLVIAHPVSGETLELEAPLPQDFESALALLRESTRQAGAPESPGRRRG
jgi:23S rRNA pseudouridine1911/1915/1917 synthase